MHAPVIPNHPLRSLPFPRDPDFVGREDVMNNIKRCLESTGSVALTGEGGIGYVVCKTVEALPPY